MFWVIRYNASPTPRKVRPPAVPPAGFTLRAFLVRCGLRDEVLANEALLGKVVSHDVGSGSDTISDPE